MKPRVCVVAEYYPRDDDPVLGRWAHLQAVAAAEAGADVRVLVLHRTVPARSGGSGKRTLAALKQRGKATIDGIPVEYVRYISPPPSISYAQWHRYATPFLRRALKRMRGEREFDLIHAHYAVPGAAAVLATGANEPIVVSIHGGDVYGQVEQNLRWQQLVSTTLEQAQMVLANSAETARRAAAAGAHSPRVVHLGSDLPATERRWPGPVLTTLGHLVPRKHHADVLQAVATLLLQVPDLQYRIIGDGPERPALEQLASQLGVSAHVEFLGQLPHDLAVAEVQRGAVMALPSSDEAFGVAYIEAMAAGVPVVGAEGEAGPTELLAAGGGIELVPTGDPEALSDTLLPLLTDREANQRLGRAARNTVEQQFTWQRCGAVTVECYQQVLAEHQAQASRQ